MPPVAFKLNAYGLGVQTAFSDLTRLTVLAEELGFDGVYLIDHLFMPDAQLQGFSTQHLDGRPFFPDTWSLLPALAAVSDKVRLGPQVSPSMRLDPVFLARAGAAIDWISGGRFCLQVGMGWNPAEYEAFGLPYEPSITVRARRLEETIEVIRLFWEIDGAVTHHGEFFELNGAPLWPKPVTVPRPPIWVGGSGEHARRIAAKCGDGWTPAAPHYGGMRPDTYAEAIFEIRTRAERDYGRDPQSITAAGFFFVVVAPTDAEAQRTAEHLTRRDIWADLSVGELAERGIAFIGCPERVASMMKRYVDAGVEYFTVGFMPIQGWKDTATQMGLFKDVLAELQGPPAVSAGHSKAMSSGIGRKTE